MTALLAIFLLPSPMAPVCDEYFAVEFNTTLNPATGQVHLRQLVFWDVLACGHLHACTWRWWTEDNKTPLVTKDTRGTYVRFWDQYGVSRKVYCREYRVTTSVYDVETEDRGKCYWAPRRDLVHVRRYE